jgi:hypothetical protein
MSRQLNMRNAGLHCGRGGATPSSLFTVGLTSGGPGSILPSLAVDADGNSPRRSPRKNTHVPGMYVTPPRAPNVPLCITKFVRWMQSKAFTLAAFGSVQSEAEWREIILNQVKMADPAETRVVIEYIRRYGAIAASNPVASGAANDLVEHKSPAQPAVVVVSPAKLFRDAKTVRAVSRFRLDWDIPVILDDVTRALYLITRPPCPERQRLLDYMKALYVKGPLVESVTLVSITMCALSVCLL